MKLAVAVLAILLPAQALADDLLCGPVEKGTLQLDGLTDDWVDVTGIEAGGASLDLAFSFKCNSEGGKLYFLVDVRDSYFVRTKQNHPGEDHVELTLGQKRLTIYPGNARDIPTKASWKEVKASSALQEKGWAIEFMVPLSSVGKGTTPIPFKLTVADSDSKATLKTDKTLVAAGNLVFAEGDAALDAFLGDRTLKRGDIWFDKGLDTGKKSSVRIVLAGRFMAAISDGYVYVELPVQLRSDVKEVKLVDLAGDGWQAVVVRYIERGNGGSREMLAVFRPGEGQIARSFAAEVAKTLDAGGRVDDKVTFVKRGRATDIVIEAGSATMSRAAWQDTPAIDETIPLMLPWDANKRARYQFSGDGYKRAP